MPQTDIVKARAIRRAGHACEVCGAPVRLRSARFLDVRPVLGAMFDAEECCVLCERCFADLDPKDDIPPGRPGDRATVAQEGSQAGNLVTKDDMQQATREAWFTDEDPDGGLCA